MRLKRAIIRKLDYVAKRFEPLVDDAVLVFMAATATAGVMLVLNDLAGLGSAIGSSTAMREFFIAVGVGLFSLYMTLTGLSIWRAMREKMIREKARKARSGSEHEADVPYRRRISAGSSGRLTAISESSINMVYESTGQIYFDRQNQALGVDPAAFGAIEPDGFSMDYDEVEEEFERICADRLRDNLDF